MQFILAQQAQFTVGIQKLEEAQTRTDQIVNCLANATLGRFEELDQKIAVLVDSQIRLNESQKHTDETLRNLIAVVDRYFTGKDDTNGQT